MKKLIFFLVFLIFADSAAAQIIRRTEPLEPRSAAQITVGQYRPTVKNIDYMLEHYTDGELKNYAKALNDAAIESAKKAGEPVPEKLSDEVLKSRKKIGEYLRSYFNVPY